MADLEDLKKETISGAEDEFLEEKQTLSFDDMVSFTMFAEVLMIGLCMFIFLMDFLLATWKMH